MIIPFGVDLSFPTATLFVSNQLPTKPSRHRRVTASIIAATVYYSISLGPGIAGTVEAQVKYVDILRRFREDWYTAIGMSEFGAILAIVHDVIDVLKTRKIQADSNTVKENGDGGRNSV